MQQQLRLRPGGSACCCSLGRSSPAPRAPATGCVLMRSGWRAKGARLLEVSLCGSGRRSVPPACRKEMHLAKALPAPRGPRNPRFIPSHTLHFSKHRSVEHATSMRAGVSADLRYERPAGVARRDTSRQGTPRPRRPGKSRCTLNAGSGAQSEVSKDASSMLPFAAQMCHPQFLFSKVGQRASQRGSAFPLAPSARQRQRCGSAAVPGARRAPAMLSNARWG